MGFDAHAERIRVFRDTMNWIYASPALELAVAESRTGTRLYQESQTPSLPENPNFQTKVSVTTSRSFEAAMRLRGEFPEERIAVHNFASATNPGGGVEHGAGAQEECLCRCSTLFPVLKTQELFDSYYNYHINRHDVLYTNACIWSPDILILKTDTTSPQRMPESEWCKVDVLTCAAPNLRHKPYNRMNPGSGEPANVSDAYLSEIHQKRARHLLSVAAANGDTVLVLGAFGCGAFRNPPEIVAQAYKDVLPEFAGYFKHIEFAVYCPPDYPENFETFSRILA